MVNCPHFYNNDILYIINLCINTWHPIQSSSVSLLLCNYHDNISGADYRKHIEMAKNNETVNVMKYVSLVLCKCLPYLKGFRKHILFSPY